MLYESAFVWFSTHAQTEKHEIEKLFSKLTRNENVMLRKNLQHIFMLEDDKWDMLDILDGVDVLLNTIKIALRSITNGDNLESQIIKNISFECVIFAFLIVKRHLVLYAKIEQKKNDPFFRGSDYQSIYGFCKVFCVNNKLSIVIGKSYNLLLKDWLNFDETSNIKFETILQELSINTFSDACLICDNEKVIQNIIDACSIMNDFRLSIKFLNLKLEKKMIQNKYSFISF